MMRQTDLEQSDLFKSLKKETESFMKGRVSSKPKKVYHPPLPPKKSERDRDILHAMRNR